MKRGILVAVALWVLLSGIGISTAVGQRLVGITGNQASGGPGDETLYDIDVVNGTITMLHRFQSVPDTDAIAFNPQDGLLYRTSGAESYSNNTGSPGYRDNHYLQTIDIVGGTPYAEAAIFNANSEQWGLPAPRPTWLLPTERRTDAQNTNEFQDARGPNEYHSMRDFTWSDEEQLFYGADETGIYRLTATGQSTFVGQPGGQPKGITFATVGGSRKLFLSDRDGPELWIIDPATGQHIGDPVRVRDPRVPEVFVSGLLSLTEIPESEFLYAIHRNDPNTPSSRELIAIHPVTGDSFSLMPFGTHMADLAMLPPASPPRRPGDVDGDGNVNRTDVALFADHFGTQTGATPDTGNFNRDGKTGLLDLIIVQQNLDPFIAGSPVPEPATGILALVGTAAFCAPAHRRRGAPV
jgi:hypothetical protein